MKDKTVDTDRQKKEKEASKRRFLFKVISAELPKNWLLPLSLLFCKFINTTAYHLGRYEPSSPVPKLPFSPVQFCLKKAQFSHFCAGSDIITNFAKFLNFAEIQISSKKALLHQLGTSLYPKFLYTKLYCPSLRNYKVSVTSPSYINHLMTS